MRFFITICSACVLIQAILISGVSAVQDETPEVNIRLANGAPVEGAFVSAAPEGLTIQSAKGTTVLPWKYLSAGTRWRYERPMRAELKAQQLKAEQETKAKAAEASKAAADGKKSTKAAAPSPAPLATNKPAASPGK